jgi:methylmalonyl-CoA/ethylmalonyl-CoA epimerase
LIATFDPPGLAFFDLGATRLLVEKGEPGGTHVLYFDVDDIVAGAERLKARGVALDAEPHVIFADDAGQFGPAGDEEWMAFFRDPSGNVLALHARRRPAS